MADADRMAFHAASGLEDWRVLYCGPIAHFATASLIDGARFALAVAELDALDTRPPFLDVTPHGVTVRLDADLLDLDAATAVDRARAVSAVADRHGLPARPDRVQDLQLAIASRRPIADIVPFWKAILGYADHHGDDLLDPLGRGPTVWFQQLDAAKELRHAMHIDLAVPREAVRERLRAAAAARGRAAHDGGVHFTRADAAGNKVDLVAWPDLAVPEEDRGGGAEIDAQLDAAARRRAGAPGDGPPAGDGPPPPDPAEAERGEAAWHAFRAASDLADWPVVFTGPTAWFATASAAGSARLAVAIAGLAGADRVHLDLRAEGLAVRLAREVAGLVPDDLDLARAISAAARDHDARAEPTRVQAMQIAIASNPADDVRPFWRELFGYAELGDEDLVDLTGRQVNLWFQRLRPDAGIRHAFHVDVSVPRAIRPARIAAALAAGGRIADDSHAPDWWTLADPAGNKVDLALWADRDDG